MKIKTDLYTKIMLTAVVALLAAHLVKDINFVEKANASTLNPSELKIENVNYDEPKTYFIYENAKITTPISRSSGGFLGGSTTGNISNKDIPTYIITDKSGSIYIR